MKTAPFIRSLLAWLCLATNLAWAEELPQSEAPPWYQFEIIIFERTAAGAGSTEYWPNDGERPSVLNALPIDLGPQPEPSVEDEASPVAYQPLPASELQLSAEVARLQRSRNYRPLLHGAWRQQVVKPAEAQTLLIHFDNRDGSVQEAQNAAPTWLEGTLRVGVKRYLHLEADLLLRKWPLNGATDTAGGDFRSYRMRANRRMRSGELHYLDHPLLGILFTASRYQLPEAEEPAEETTVEVAEPTPQSAPAEAAPTSPATSPTTEPTEPTEPTESGQ